MASETDSKLKPDVCRTYIVRCSFATKGLEDPEYTKLQEALAEGFVVADIVVGQGDAPPVFAYLLRRPDTSWVNQYKG